jgi:hypothetical protein
VGLLGTPLGVVSAIGVVSEVSHILVNGCCPWTIDVVGIRLLVGLSSEGW